MNMEVINIKDIMAFLDAYEASQKKRRDERLGLQCFGPSQLRYLFEKLPKFEAEPVQYGEWIDGRCSECGTEAPSTSWDEPIYDYDWEENLRYSHTETHIEYSVTNYCSNCGALMDGGHKYDY